MSDIEGIYHNVGKGFAHVWEDAGWERLDHVYEGVHHGEYGVMMRWRGEGEPVYPGKTVGRKEMMTAVVAVVTGDSPDDRYITLGPGDGTCQQWKLTDEQLKKLRREINQKLD